MIRSALAINLALSLSGCATGRELNGSCRQIVHEAKTGQLDTKNTWRGEGCKPAVIESVEP